MSKIIKYSLIGIVISSIIPISAAFIIPKIEQNFINISLLSNSYLPENYYLSLNKNFSFNGGNGEFLLYKKENNQNIDIATISFEIPYKYYNLIFQKKFPIVGSLELKNKEFEQNFNTKINYKEDNLLRFKGTFDYQGDMNLLLNQVAYQIVLSDTQTKDNILFIDIEPSTGVIDFKNHQLTTSFKFPKVLLKDQEFTSDNINFNNSIIETSFNTNPLDKEKISSASIKIESIIDGSIAKHFTFKEIESNFSFKENTDTFINDNKIKINNINFDYLQNVNFGLDYSITVPKSSKQSLIDFILSMESNDILQRQGAFFNILRSGFKFNLNDLHIKENDNQNILKTNFSLNVDKEEKDIDFTKRIQFNGEIQSTGNLAETSLNVAGLSLEDILGDEAQQQKDKNSFFINFDYQNQSLNFNNNKASDEYNKIVQTSLLNLELLLQEGEDDYNKSINETPPTDDDTKDIPEIIPQN